MLRSHKTLVSTFASTIASTIAGTLALSLAVLAPLALTACDPAPSGHGAGAEPENVVLLPVESDPTVTFMLWFAVGTQNDPPGKEGLAALTANLIAQGATTENSWDEILAKLYPMASSYEVRVDKEMTTLSGRTHRDNLEAFFGLFTDAFLRPSFSETDFRRLRDEQRNYLEKTLRYSSDEDLGKAALTSFVFEKTSYAHPSEGTVGGLSNITLDDVRQFYTAHYTRDNTVPALGGGYSDDLVERFSSSLELLAEGQPETVPAATPPAFEGRQVLLVDKPGADASISFGFPIDVHRGERDYYALWIANSWLGEHRNSSSHLYQVIREERGMNYGDYSYIEVFSDGGENQMPPTNVARRQQIFEVWIRTLPNEMALFALRAALREVTDLIEHGMSEEEFELTRSFLSKYCLHFAETTEERLGYAVDDRFYGIDGAGHLALFREMMRSITRQEVNEALKKHLQVDDLKIAIVTGTAETLHQALVQDQPSPMDYASEKSVEILAEDEEISSFPLNISADAVRLVPVDEIFEN